MKWFNSLVQALVARLYSQEPTARFKQRGASALEYIVLAAVIVTALVLVGTLVFSEGDNKFVEFFNNIFDKADVTDGS